mmetsp:Transcript_129169/g.414068  ORF Transcript_129169/g.414068 Transcript_129169/m.414068 type:complete len:235 (+) Transcript_129169:503-1207(+)
MGRLGRIAATRWWQATRSQALFLASSLCSARTRSGGPQCGREARLCCCDWRGHHSRRLWVDIASFFFRMLPFALSMQLGREPRRLRPKTSRSPKFSLWPVSARKLCLASLCISLWAHLTSPGPASLSSSTPRQSLVFTMPCKLVSPSVSAASRLCAPRRRLSLQSTCLWALCCLPACSVRPSPMQSPRRRVSSAAGAPKAKMCWPPALCPSSPVGGCSASSSGTSTKVGIGWTP